MCSQDLNSPSLLTYSLTHLLLLLKYNTVHKYKIYWGDFVRGDFVRIPAFTFESTKSPLASASVVGDKWSNRAFHAVNLPNKCNKHEAFHFRIIFRTYVLYTHLNQFECNQVSGDAKPPVMSQSTQKVSIQVTLHQRPQKRK